MRKRDRKLIDEILRKYGCCVKSIRRNKHVVLTVINKYGVKFNATAPLTSSDWRAERNFERDVRLNSLRKNA